jgi:preprotein translocase SecE subunit
MSKPTSTSSAPIPKAGRGGLKGFVADVSRELKKVQWPTPRETSRLTGVVIAVCAICLVIIFIFSIVVETLVGMLTRG